MVALMPAPAPGVPQFCCTTMGSSVAVKVGSGTSVLVGIGVSVGVGVSVGAVADAVGGRLIGVEMLGSGAADPGTRGKVFAANVGEGRIGVMVGGAGIVASNAGGNTGTAVGKGGGSAGVDAGGALGAAIPAPPDARGTAPIWKLTLPTSGVPSQGLTSQPTSQVFRST